MSVLVLNDCDLNPGPTAPESSTLTTRLPSHPITSSSALFSLKFRLRLYISSLRVRGLPPVCKPTLSYVRTLADGRRQKTLPRECEAVGLHQRIFTTYVANATTDVAMGYVGRGAKYRRQRVPGKQILKMISRHNEN